ncbi:MAG TPA: glycoside hydrolase family 3 N-terminal domain-containing protein [Ktedonobacteraceae bacterium]|nr:glycoside hydrolase family 3 N-terminal domain-containing protein [Ktedonobacteraceae bacterium]
MTDALNTPAPTPTQVVKPTATPSPVQAKTDSKGIATEAVQRAELARIQSIMAGMTLDQKLGQLIIVEYIGNHYQDGLQYMISQQFVGGYMYQESNHNFDTPYDVASQVNALSQQAMQDAKVPLMIATDQEGGLVNRLYKFHGYLPSAADMAATGTPSTALTQGTQAAKWMLELGINTDFAPVVDVHTVDPAILASRMFGRDPKTVAAYAGAYLNGLQNNGVAGCLKHFPGLGAITSDPHTGLPTVNRSMAALNNIDLAPYKLMISQDHPAMIMSTDVLMPAIDPSLPAELSPKAITGVLRNQLGYNGVVVTDGLYMHGISETWSLSQAAVLAIIAGNDMIEGPYTPSLVASVVTALKQAIQQGKLTIDRINQSVERILLLKILYGVIK